MELPTDCMDIELHGGANSRHKVSSVRSTMVLPSSALQTRC